MTRRADPLPSDGKRLQLEYGDPRLPEHFWSGVFPEPNTGCWLWGRSLGAHEYGQYHEKARSGIKKPIYPHRLAYSVFHGVTIPAGMQIDHLCRVRWCCNPEHLDLVTPRENVLRSPLMGGKTHCLRGHEFSVENTRWRLVTKSGYPQRSCRACDRLHEAASRRRRQAAS